MHLTGILPNIDYFCIKKQKMINIIKQKYRFTNTESWFADKIDKKNKLNEEINNPAEVL